MNEGIDPTVHPGELVLAGQQIGTFVPGSSTGIEIGFADSSGVPLSHATYHEGDVTRWGRKMAAFLSSIGAPGSLNDRFSQLLQPQAVEQGDQATRTDPEPDRAHLAVAVLASRSPALEEARLARRLDPGRRPATRLRAS